MPIKVFISPHYDLTIPDRAEGGIKRVAEAQVKYLPDYGVKVVDNISKADIYNAHVRVENRPASMPLIHSVHGLHWVPDYNWHNWAHEVNAMVIGGMKQADAITAPSRWVAHALTRGMYCDPKVIYHGVDPLDWAHNFDQDGYILWNKARADSVSDPSEMQKLATFLPKQQFVSTIGTPTPNLSIIGVQPLPTLKGVIQRAGVYLATARETFGVGTLEALACGVPVVGWDYGGQSEIIIEGETGYLAPYGNYEALAECVEKALRERSRLSPNCIADVQARWLWPDKIGQYADLFKRVLEGRKAGPKVSVIITCHNLAHFLPDALNSVLSQGFQDWEALIVDDFSTDNTPQVAEDYARRDSRIKYLRTPRNLKLSLALNYGAEHSQGRYLLNLDADNMLGENALQIQNDALDEHPDVHIVYGMVDTISRDGQNRSRAEGWPFDFDWRTQMAHLNCIQSSAMHRREVRLLSGGYRERMWRAEDGEFWSRVTSFGFNAKKVTDYTTLIYRNRGDSKSSGEYNTYPDRDGDWVAGFPWRLASTAQAGVEALKKGKKIPNAKIVPFSAAGKPEINNKFAWNTPHHQEPLISVIIPVGPGHKAKVIDALDSLIAQNLNNWEAIVVNDTGEAWDTVAGAPWAKVFSTGGTKGTGAARNLGVSKSKGKILYFLDADDYMTPHQGLRSMLREYAKGKAAYIYSDYIDQGNGGESEYRIIQKSADRGDFELPFYARNLTDKTLIQDFVLMHEEQFPNGGKTRYVQVNDRESFRLLELPEYEQTRLAMYHAVNIMIAKVDFWSVGGFDEGLRGWEDWDFVCKLAVSGLCGQRVAYPCFVYRKHEGWRSSSSYALKEELIPLIEGRYHGYETGEKTMAGCGCGVGADAILAAKQAIANSEGGVDLLEAQAESKPLQSGITPEAIRMEFIGPQVGAVSFFGKNGRTYRGGNNVLEKYADMHPEDADYMASTGQWRRVNFGLAPEPPPQSEVESVEVSLPPVMVGEADKANSFLTPQAETVAPVLEAVGAITETKKAKRGPKGKLKKSAKTDVWDPLNETLEAFSERTGKAN